MLRHPGANDQGAKDFDADIGRPLKDIVAFLRTKNPGAAVVIARFDFNGGNAATIRPLVEAMAKKIDTKKSPVRTVATYAGRIENPEQAGSDTFDWAHPNERGQAKLAGKFSPRWSRFWVAARRQEAGDLEGTSSEVIAEKVVLYA